MNFVIDIKGVIFEVNNSALKFLGYSKKEMVGRFVLKFVSKKDSKRLMRDLKKSFKNDICESLECDVISKNKVLKIILK